MTGLTQYHVEDVCGLGNGERTCAFLMLGGPGAVWSCAKATGIEPVIRARLEAGTMTAKGDNCAGPPAYERPATP